MLYSTRKSMWGVPSLIYGRWYWQSRRGSADPRSPVANPYSGMHHESCNQGYYQSKMGVVLRCPGFPYSVRSLLMYFEPGISPISGHYLPCSPFDLSQIFDTRVRWELAFLFLVEGLLIVKQSSALKKSCKCRGLGVEKITATVLLWLTLGESGILVGEM